MTFERKEALARPSLLPQSDCFVFLETQPHYTPASGYKEYCRIRQEKGLQHPLLYTSTTITSGGYRRDTELPIGDAIAANSQLARQIVDEGLLHNGVDQNLIILPSELGKVSGWKQTDYLQFWLYIIRAVHPNSAEQLEEQWFRNPDSQLPDMGELMESAPSADIRRNAYTRFVGQYHEMRDSMVAGKLLTPHWQAPVVVPLFDNDMSLGCSAEYYFAESVLPTWALSPQSDELRDTTTVFLGRGAMVAGMSDENAQHSRATNEAKWMEYHAAKG